MLAQLLTTLGLLACLVIMPINQQYPVLLFDGHCNLCNGAVQWVLKHDKTGIYRFASLQSELGQELLQSHKLNPEALDSMVLIDKDQAYVKSTAALKVATGLGGGYALAKYLLLLPRGLRNAVYDFIARNRYRWFGRKEECWLPKPEWKARFLA